MRNPADTPNWSAGRTSIANEGGHDRRHRAVETNDVERARIVRIGNRETVGGHTDHNQLGADTHLLPVLAERLHRMNLAIPRLAVGVDHEHIDLRLVLGSPDHWQRAVGAAHLDRTNARENVVESLARRDTDRRNTGSATTPSTAVAAASRGR